MNPALDNLHYLPLICREKKQKIALYKSKDFVITVLLWLFLETVYLVT